METITYNLIITLTKSLKKGAQRFPWPEHMRGPKQRRAQQKLLEKAKVFLVKGNKLYCKIKFTKTIKKTGPQGNF